MEIYILDSNINTVDVISTYDAIIWRSKWHEPGSFKASFIFTEKLNQILQLGNLVYKTDEEEPAIITRKYLKLSKNGEETIVIQGFMASRYLNQRIIWNKMILKGTYESVMRKMVYENVIAPSNTKRIIPKIRLGELKGFGGEIDKQISYDNLQESLTEISKVSELGYRLRLDIADKLLYFEVMQGVNRTMGSNNPCIFTRDFGNVFTQEYSEDESNYKNVCLVGGNGEDLNRIMKEVGDSEGIARKELFCNAAGLSNSGITSAEYLEQLAQNGKERLSNFYYAKAFESKINQEKAMEYQLGDYVTCTDDRWNITVNTQIKDIEKGLSKSEKSYVVTFGDDVPTLIDLIKAKEK